MNLSTPCRSIEKLYDSIRRPVLLSLGLLLGALPLHATELPNVLLIVADDMGYGDLGANGCSDIPTPHLDSLAASGARFTAGYVTHPYCSPSRAAIMSGRYQARIGHDNNPQESLTDESQGIMPGVELLPARLGKVGFQSALIGKWHLGHADPFKPLERGFDHFYGFLSGGYSYWGKRKNPGDPIYDDSRAVPTSEITYLTTDLGRAAIRFTKKQSATPWFCFLSYNAPHAPDQAPEETIAKFVEIEDPKRRIYAAMVSKLDDSIGEVIAALGDQGQLEDTLVFFISDNGGRIKSADNGIYRGHKGRTYEGGIRVPFLASWPGTIPAGTVVQSPVSSLDIYATALALAGVPDSGAEGTDLMPALTHGVALPTRPLFYRISGGWGYAVSEAPYKLVKPGWKEGYELYHTGDDPRETTDLIKEEPEVARRLAAAYDEWNKDNIDPRWTDAHRANVAREMADRSRGGQ